MVLPLCTDCKLMIPYCSLRQTAQLCLVKWIWTLPEFGMSCTWVYIKAYDVWKTNRICRNWRQLLSGPNSHSRGCVCLNPLGSSCDECRSEGGLPVRKQTLFHSQPLPKRPRCCGWDHTRLASIYHFVREKPTTQETIKHCKRPRYQTPRWLLDEEALPFSSKSHYA